MPLIIDKIKGPLIHKHKSEIEAYGDWKIKIPDLETIRFGSFFNHYALTGISPICTDKAHVPSLAEYNIMFDVLGGAATAAPKLRSNLLDTWNQSAICNNSSGFNMTGSGRRFGNYEFLGSSCVLWTSDIFSGTHAKVVEVSYNSNAVVVTGNYPKYYGFTVRLIIDTPEEINGSDAIYTGCDGRRYKCRLIGAQWWLAENLCETQYFNTIPIPEVLSDITWISRTDGARANPMNDPNLAITSVITESNVNSHDVVEFVPGKNIALELLDKKLKISSLGVAGPDFGTDNIICVFDGLTGKLIKMSNVTIDAAGQMRINAVGVGLTATSDYVGIEAIAMGPDSFAYSGISDHVPMQLANTDANATGNRITLVHRGDSAHLVASNGFGLKEQFRLPHLGWDPAHPEMSEIPGGEFICKLTDNTQNAEYSAFEWWLQKNGILTKAMWIDGNGNLNVAGTVNGSAGAVSITSIDNSVKVTPTETGVDLSVNRAELELYANNETELLAAWAIADASLKSARIYITGNITFTADRQFLRAYGLTRIKFEAITAINFYAGAYVIDFNNIDFTNIWFRTTGPFYLRLVGGYASFLNCTWPDETIDTGARKKNIVVTGPITNGTASIKLKTTVHNTQSPSDNGTALIQPFWIENQADFVGATSRIYVEILEMSASFESARFARILLTSTAADCPYSVTGDESWFYAPGQFLPGTGNIKASANILRSTYVDKLITNDKVYSGLLSQTGTNAPTISIYKDTVGAPVWARTAAGTYTLTKAGAFVDLKTIPIEDTYTDQAGNLYEINRTSADVMTLKTYAAANTSVLADGVLNNRYINIEIYS